MKKTQAGFTLVELMVALIAGAFVVAGVYYLNGVTSRSFAEQMRVSETQMSLRSAMEQLRRDFSRAGYMGVPSSALVPDCGGTVNANGMGTIAPRWVQAISVTRDGSLGNGTVSSLLNVAVNKTRADQVDVWGNYATPEVYLADPLGSNANAIYFQPGSEGFRRSFYDPAAANGTASYNAARFSATFAPGRMVRIENEGRVFFRDIAAVVTPAAPLNLSPGSPWPYVTFTSSLPACFVSSAWTSIAPVMHLRYSLEPDSTTDLGRLQSANTATGTAATALPGTRRTMLVRREWRDDTATAVPFTSRLVLDYAVEFAVEAWTNTNLATNPAGRPSWALQKGNAVTTASTVNPHLFRSLLVTLTARSAEVDPRLPAGSTRAPFGQANVLDAPMMLFRVANPLSATLILNARTRTLRSEIFLQNL